MMKSFYDTYKQYPNLVMELLEYFRPAPGLKDRTVTDFALAHKGEDGDPIQPDLINRICQKLCSKDIMSHSPEIE